MCLAAGDDALQQHWDEHFRAFLRVEGHGDCNHDPRSARTRERHAPGHGRLSVDGRICRAAGCDLDLVETTERETTSKKESRPRPRREETATSSVDLEERVDHDRELDLEESVDHDRELDLEKRESTSTARERATTTSKVDLEEKRPRPRQSLEVQGEGRMRGLRIRQHAGAPSAEECHQHPADALRLCGGVSRDVGA